MTWLLYALAINPDVDKKVGRSRFNFEWLVCDCVVGSVLAHLAMHQVHEELKQMRWATSEEVKHRPLFWLS